MLRLVVLLLLSLCCLGNETYYANPSVKKASSNGTKAKPWGSLEEAISKGYFKKVKPGDTVLLLSGFHGNVKIAGANKDFITLAGKGGAESLAFRAKSNMVLETSNNAFSAIFSGSV